MLIQQYHPYTNSVSFTATPPLPGRTHQGANPANGGYQWGVLFNSPSLGGVGFDGGNGTMAWSIIGDAGNQQLRRQFDFLIITYVPHSWGMLLVCSGWKRLQRVEGCAAGGKMCSGWKGVQQVKGCPVGGSICRRSRDLHFELVQSSLVAAIGHLSRVRVAAPYTYTSACRKHINTTRYYDLTSS